MSMPPHGLRPAMRAVRMGCVHALRTLVGKLWTGAAYHMTSRSHASLACATSQPLIACKHSLDSRFGSFSFPGA